MDVIYKIGVIIGIIAIYTLVTMGLGALFTLSSKDSTESMVCSWGIGLVAFIVLAIFTLTKFNLWGNI